MTTAARPSFAVIPAAGLSERMGRPKLLLPWGPDVLLIDHVLRSWRESRVAKIVAVVRPGDALLAERCRVWCDEVVVPSAPPADMKASVRLGLRRIAEAYRPEPSDAWLVAPADIPGISSGVINRLLDEHQIVAENRDREAPPLAIIPVFRGRRGHPVLFSWEAAARVDLLPAEAGLNRLMADIQVREIPSSEEGSPDDIDTPEDYRRLHPSPPPSFSPGGKSGR